MMTRLNKITKKFLAERDDTGRYIIVDIRSGRKFFVEPISNQRDGDWGSYNPGTGNIEHKKGDGKHKGAVTAKESIVNKKNFDVVHELAVGESPMDFINGLLGNELWKA